MTTFLGVKGTLLKLTLIKTYEYTTFKYGGFMKKLSLFLVAIILGFTALLTGCGNKKSNVVRVNEVTHSVFYAPLYIAINKGFFEEEGLKIELTNGGGADKVMSALTSNSADIGLMGPEATVYVVNQGKKDKPVVFGQLTKRDGSFLIGRKDIKNFKVSDITGGATTLPENERPVILAGRAGGVPAMTLAYMLKENGLIDGQNITLRYDVPFDSMTAAFIGNVGDYVTAFEPAASSIVAQGKGYNLASVGSLSGEIPYTAFTANSSYITKNPDKINKFLRAIIKGYNYLITASVDDVVKALAPSFVGTSEESLKNSFLAYKNIDAWSDTLSMKETAYNRLIDIIIDNGVLAKRVEFSNVVDNSYAEKAYKEIQIELAK